jgi:ABC-type uncharacterized transport system involved in gliding motility auxiliary subunit
MDNSWMKARQTKYWLYASVYTIVIVAVLGAANYLASQNSKALDTTTNKRFSLADQTEKVVKGLKNDAKILYFDKTADFPRAKDLLDRYDALSSKLSVEYIDVDKKPTIAKQYGVRNYGAIFVDAAGKREEARSLSEEEVTSAIIRTQKTGDRKVCAVTGSGEHSFDDSQRSGYSALKALIEKNNYKTQSIKLLEKPEVPADCTILLIAGPRFDYVQPAVDAIAKYFGTGGRVLVAVDPPMQVGRETISENAPLMKMLEGWGVIPQKNLILDTSGIGQLFGLSEVFALVTAYENHIIVRDMKESATAYPLSRSIEIKSVPNITPEKLFSTSGNSYATTNLSAAEIKINPDKDKAGPFVLAAAATVSSGNTDTSKNGRFVIVGSSGFMANNILAFNGNRDLAMNMLNWLAADEDLISIRPKDPQDRRLNMTRRQMSMIFYTSVILLPLFVIGAGISVWWKRR